MHDHEGEGVNDRNITTLQAQSKYLRSENAYLKSEYENMKENRADVVSQNQVLVSQNQVLQQRVQDLESQAMIFMPSTGVGYEGYHGLTKLLPQ